MNPETCASFNLTSGKQPRYYQEIAINRVVQAVLQQKRRMLLTMATGTGKTMVAFQICWKLWSSRWNTSGDYRRPRILFLADRNILVDDPKDKIFSTFGDARWKIENGVANKSRELYFAIYQALAKDENRPGLYKEFAPDFFDLIIVDECHRGSANEKGSWREILEYFAPAYQLGLTATPLREDNKDTSQYFGNPLYQYSLKQGIQDGFLAPYRVHRVIKYTDFTAETVRTLYPSADVMRKRWANAEQRAEIIEMLAERGISFDELAAQMKYPDADPFDLLCHLAFNAPLLTRRQRAEKLRREKKDFFDQFGDEARAILNEVLNKYAEHGITEFAIPDTLKNEPISSYGNVIEIANYFGGANQLRNAVNEMQNLLYAA